MPVSNNEAETLLVEQESQHQSPIFWIYILFLASGVPALIYQIVWQRALFAIYGINIESVTIVVSAFMLGLGLGSLGGGALSRSRRISPIVFFAAAELGTAVFGLISLSVFHHVAQYTVAKPLWTTGLLSFVLVVVPTILMGSTLPLLVEYLVRSSHNVGSSLGALYFVNTLGSGVACIVIARPLMNYFGQSGSVRCAALVNALVGGSALFYSYHFNRTERKHRSPGELRPSGAMGRPLFPFSVALICSAFCGLTALSYEIIWYRLLAFATADSAPIFASLLGSYLVGIALGSRFAETFAERHSRETAIPILGITILTSAVVAFWVSPISALALQLTSFQGAGFFSSLLLLFFVCHGAMLFGALFPLIAYVSVGKESVGTSVSYLYAANIAGSTLGVLLVGFVLMDRFSLYQIGLMLLIGGVFCAVATFLVPTTLPRRYRGAFGGACAVAILISPLSRPVFGTIYDRLLFKDLYPDGHFQEVIENRSGTIGVTPNGTVFGGGAYDGRFNTDLLNDTNMIVRPYSLSAFHPDPSHVLMIGLGSGSWAQVVANHPQVQDLTVVEINHGYLEAIAKHPATASLLSNRKVTIISDDGRRWLLHNPQAKFDVIVMNTTFHWRNHITNLLSVDFLQIVRQHLRSGGVLFYNTTRSEDVVATGLTVFPHAVRLLSCLALSDSPLFLNRDRWRSVLLDYVIDGNHVVDAENPQQMKKLEELVNLSDSPPVGEWISIENDIELRKRFQKRRSLIITDDNMGLEWR
jgi:spermidine synthase